jgi:hypothetical protein
VGHATQVLHASSQLLDLRDVSRSVGDMELVVKVYWPEASRAGEGKIIDMAHQIALHNSNVNGHVPDMIYSYNLVKYSTNRIHVALGIVSESHHVLCIMIFR